MDSTGKFMLWVLHIVEVKHEVRQIHLKISYGSAGKESACSEGDLGSIPWLGRSPGEGNGYPLQYSGQENSMDCIVHGFAKSWTWLTFTFTFHPLWCWGWSSQRLAKADTRHPHPFTSLFLSSHIFYTWLDLGFFMDGNFRIVGILTWWAQDSTN